MKEQIEGGIEHWSRMLVFGRPKKMPDIPEGHEFVCGIDQGNGEELVICETLQEMEMLYQEYITGNAVHLFWYLRPPTPEHVLSASA